MSPYSRCNSAPDAHAAQKVSARCAKCAHAGAAHRRHGRISCDGRVDRKLTWLCTKVEIAPPAPSPGVLPNRPSHIGQLSVSQ